MKVDFNTLYTELGVDPDCDLDDLRRAYRRRLSNLHPDRIGERRATQAQLSLQQLKQLYERSLDFHRQYGRLPGGRATATPPAAMPANGWTHATATLRAEAPLPEAASRSNPKRSRSALVPWLLLALAAAALYYSLQLNQDDAAGTAAAAPEATRIAIITPASEQAALHVGMHKSDVIAIQGAPIETRGNHWWYGPSWLRFDEEERLVAWYDSPLHPLQVAASGNTPDNSEPAARNPAPGK